MRYSVQSRDRIFVKSSGFLSFAKNMGKNITKHHAKHMINNLEQIHFKLAQNFNSKNSRSNWLI